MLVRRDGRRASRRVTDATVSEAVGEIFARANTRRLDTPERRLSGREEKNCDISIERSCMSIQSRGGKTSVRPDANPVSRSEMSTVSFIQTRNRVRRPVESRAGRRRPRTLNAHDGARQRFLLALARGAQGDRPRLQECRRRVRAARRPRLRRARRVRGGGEAEQKGPRREGTNRGHGRGTARANGRHERACSLTRARTRGNRARLAPASVASSERRGVTGRCTKTLVRLFQWLSFFSEKEAPQRLRFPETRHRFANPKLLTEA